MTPENKQDKNDKLLNENIEKAKNVIKKFEYNKSQLSIVILIGAIPLWWYTAYNHIPFPIAFTELPATALLLLFVAIIFFLIAIALLRILIIPIKKEYKLSQESDVCLSDLLNKHGAIFFIPAFCIPIVLVFSLFIQFFQTYWVILIFILLISIGVSTYRYLWKNHTTIEIIKVLFRIISVFFWVIGIYVIFGMFLLITDTRYETYTQLIIFYLVQIVSLFVYYNLVKLNLKPLSIKQLFINHIPLLLTYLTILVLPFSTTIVSGSLYLSRLGGDYRTVYTFNDNYVDAIPDEYKCKYSKTHRSVPLYVSLSVGTSSYVRIVNNNKIIPFGIPKSAIVGQYFIPRIEKNKGKNIYDCEYREVPKNKNIKPLN